MQSVPVYGSHQPVAPAPVGGSTTSIAVVGGIAASLVLAIGMLLLRSTASVRTIPERLLEWLLLFVPPGVFESMLQQFGFDAKRYGLDAAVAAMLAAFAWLGYQVLRRGWPVPAIALLGPGVWLVIMLGVMPLTSAGFFASALLTGTAAAILGYLAVCLSYAAALALARTWPLAADGPNRPWPPARDRRALLGVIGEASRRMSRHTPAVCSSRSPLARPAFSWWIRRNRWPPAGSMNPTRIRRLSQARSPNRAPQRPPPPSAQRRAPRRACPSQAKRVICSATKTERCCRRVARPVSLRPR